jgi:hypothetical protein
VDEAHMGQPAADFWWKTRSRRAGAPELLGTLPTS